MQFTQGKCIIMQRFLMALYLILIISIPFNNTFFQISIYMINAFFVAVFLFQRKEVVLFFKSIPWLCSVLLCLAFSMGLSGILGISGMNGWAEIIKHALRFWLFLLATIYFLRKNFITRHFLLWVVFLSLFFHAANGLVQFFFGADVFNNLFGGGNRLRGAVSNPNHYGLLMALGVVLSFALGIGKIFLDMGNFSRVYGIFLFLLFGMAFWTLLQSGSRGAWLAAVMGTLVAGCVVPGFWWRRNTLILVLGLTGGLGFLFRANELFRERMQALFAGNSSYRIGVWQDCWDYFLQSPLYGYGIEAYRMMDRVYPQIKSEHNIFVTILLELGLVGFAAYLLFFSLVLWRILFVCENLLLRSVFLGLFVTILVYGQFGSTMTTDNIYLFCWYLLVAMVWADGKERESVPINKGLSCGS